MEFPQRENLHAVEIIVAVHPEHRRRGVGTAIVEHLGEVARADGRRTLNTLVDVPVAQAPTHASRSFAPKVGFESTMPGHSRRLSLPADKARIDELRQLVAHARGAADYRVLTFEAPWPDELMEDQCTLRKVMSTDEPAGDGERQEETWDPESIREADELLASREVRKLAAVAQHVPSGRIVAFSEILLADDTPDQSWQLITVVHPAHRGHRLGLAIKIANLDVLAERAPAVRFIRTGNAAVNAPMIAVNDMMGFEIVGEGSSGRNTSSRVRPAHGPAAVPAVNAAGVTVVAIDPTDECRLRRVVRGTGTRRTWSSELGGPGMAAGGTPRHGAGPGWPGGEPVLGRPRRR